jgi:tRNA pseudouridine13 synthase
LRWLEAQGLKQERRSLRVIPGDLQWQLETDQFTLEFFLPRGSFATTLLREFADCRDAQTARTRDS